MRLKVSCIEYGSGDVRSAPRPYMTHIEHAPAFTRAHPPLPSWTHIQCA
jgi:hypothetical protein